MNPLDDVAQADRAAARIMTEVVRRRDKGAISFILEHFSVRGSAHLMWKRLAE
ncbi:hypothetical protein [Parvularcula marina]|uniref:hypothetical protein n=1 Tax=Parvularcula marina TaxID=2292771 RepID=UPI0013146300|nr:hypothetical protein [Parvularcula marina]